MEDKMIIGVRNPEMNGGSANLNYIYTLVEQTDNSFKKDRFSAVRIKILVFENYELKECV